MSEAMKGKTDDDLGVVDARSLRLVDVVGLELEHACWRHALLAQIVRAQTHAKLQRATGESDDLVEFSRAVVVPGRVVWHRGACDTAFPLYPACGLVDRFLCVGEARGAEADQSQLFDRPGNGVVDRGADRPADRSGGDRGMNVASSCPQCGAAQGARDTSRVGVSTPRRNGDSTRLAAWCLLRRGRLRAWFGWRFSRSATFRRGLDDMLRAYRMGATP